jgi:hypothetical protein
MKKELDEKLCAKYPLIFRDRNAPMTHTAMCWGICTGDGWYNIIDTLCGLLTSKYRSAKERYEHKKEVFESGKPPPWSKKLYTAKEVEESRLLMEEEAAKVPVASQVKEKFGGLRFYVNAATEEHYNYITFAESMSYKTCEVCGSPGKRYTDGWHTVLCDTHAKEQNRELETDDGNESEL